MLRVGIHEQFVKSEAIWSMINLIRDCGNRFDARTTEFSSFLS